MTRRITWPAGGSVGAVVSDVDDGIAPPANGAKAATMADVTAAVGVLPTIPQPAIANVGTGGLVLLADALAAITVLRSTLNALLAELRAAGILSP